MPGERDTPKYHRWMEMTYVPVEVIFSEKDDREPATFPVGEPIVGVSCFDCFVPLERDNVKARCDGAKNPALS